MTLVPRKGVLAVAAVLDVALHGDRQPVGAGALAHRHGLPPRHLEPVLQALVRQGILRGVRGPRGGYQLARAPSQITAEEILQASRTTQDNNERAALTSGPLAQVMIPPLAQAETAFSTALAHLSIESLMWTAIRMHAA